MKKARSSWQVMCDSVHALLAREVLAKFGSNRLGYFWALAEPMAQSILMAMVFSALGRTRLSDVHIAAFLITGFVPYDLFRSIATSLPKAPSSVKALLSYRQVEPIDPIIARIIIETTTTTIIMLVLVVGMVALELSDWPDDPMAVIGATLGLIILSAGIGISFSVANIYSNDSGKILNMMLRPMIFISGVMFPASIVPTQYWFLLEWNPVFHGMELFRDGYFVQFDTELGSWYYLYGSSFCVFALSIMLYWNNRMGYLKR